MGSISFSDSAQRTIAMELDAVRALTGRINDDFERACDIMLNCKARIVVTGMGKSGHIGKKIAATLASTGSPAFFVHPGEASHGDMGMITSEDVVLALSNSGTTREVLTILPLIKRMGAQLVSMTGDKQSMLAKAADVNLDVSVATEACPLGLAPTSSTTATLVMGDAIAIALLEARGFSAEDFAFSHPGGALGIKLLLKVADIMRSGEEIPKVNEKVFLSDALLEMSAKGLGMTTVVDNAGKLKGIFTDGDLRRCLDNGHDVHKTPIADIMTANCKTINKDILAAEALHLMEERKISVLVVVNEDYSPVGAVHLHDILKAGIA
jgi:arabinose-5-phosphate isomerase